MIFAITLRATRITLKNWTRTTEHITMPAGNVL